MQSLSDTHLPHFTGQHANGQAHEATSTQIAERMGNNTAKHLRREESNRIIKRTYLLFCIEPLRVESPTPRTNTAPCTNKINGLESTINTDVLSESM